MLKVSVTWPETGAMDYKFLACRVVAIYLYVCRHCDKPRLIEALRSKRVRDIACGSSHSAAIISNGDVYTWGLGEYGRLGHGDNTTQLRPKQVLYYNILLKC